jgi:hypothetical protein
MILFYSEYCQHSKILLENIRKHDNNNIIKTVSIDLLRSLKKPIDPKIHSVPALLILNTKEYLFGKAVFDYLLLPNRGILFSNTISRDDKNFKKETIAVTNNEPSAFTLGSILSENFSSINDDDEKNATMTNDKNYNWDFIENTSEENKIVTPPADNSKDYSSKNDKKLPSMEELLKQRATDII